ncbi:HU family DNA-binding protein [Roseobacter weihaiensis]|uniref:HU family DNA-binding protein n=1 Tax=Roseobacter weihaiensis TaxID=2763262 RepID=UPI001D0A7084|nr:HU family DNA-binding protein [Roseobacter sp. H9]
MDRSKKKSPIRPVLTATGVKPRSTATPRADQDTGSAVATDKAVAQIATGKKDPLRKRELIESVVRRSGSKKRDAKPVVEAVLAELGEALADGRDLILPPLGRCIINREKIMPDGRVIILKVRQKDRVGPPLPPSSVSD